MWGWIRPTVGLAIGGDGNYVCRVFVSSDTSGASTTTALAGANVSQYYTNGGMVNKVQTDGSGFADINVSAGATYTINVNKAGHSFDGYSLAISNTVTYDTGIVFQYTDSISGTNNTSTSLCAVYFTMQSFPGEGVKNVSITTKMASRRQIYNTCSDSWYPEVEQYAGRTDSNGYITFNIPRSSCINDKKVEIYASYGSETRKIGKWVIPDSTSHELTYANRD